MNRPVFVRRGASAVAAGILALGWGLGLAGRVGAAEPASATSSLPPAREGAVDFAKDVRPIFEARCFSCHGPEKQKADLRLDQRAGARRGGESGPAWVSGKSDESLLIRLVGGLDSERAMPPKGERLTAAEIGTLRAWIDQGADWPVDPREVADDPMGHWAFQPVRRPAVPAGSTEDLAPIDAFVRARLAKDGLAPSPEAPRATLLRRLYLVLFGLAPEPEEVARFVADPDPKAFEHWVDRALQDPRYGERWGRHWLDIVRFAESNGFETNRERVNAWRFRDYVIAAFNRDLPYDRFILEQIAGDSVGTDVATGFLVGGPVDIVGSPDPTLTLQQRADELDDMVNTTGTAFLGLTLGCARCHNHKFDPIEQREYYAMTAVFSGVRHGERALPLPAETAEEVAACDRRIKALESGLERFIVKADPTGLTAKATSGVLREPVNARQNVEALASAVDARFVRFTVLESSGAEPCLDELEVYAGDRNVALAGAGVKATASGTLPGYEIHKLEHVNDGKPGNSRSWISNEPGRGWVQLEFPRVERVGRMVWGRDRDGQFGDRVPTKYRIEVAVEPGHWTVVASSDDRQPFKGGSVKPAGPPPVVYRFEGHADAVAAEGRAALAELEQVRKRRETIAKPPMIYAGNFVKPPPAYRLHRGDPMQKRETVAPATLRIFRPVELAADEPEARRRLALAQWIADPENPLTARVMVNRMWQYHFGVGLVDTPSDFGRSGSRPTHPELLDWLASELVARGWSLKAIHRAILLSATWRQSGAPRVDAARVDASSRLLWRFPPRRLEAEAIRDRILQASGDLDSTPGGPSFHLHDVDRENVYHYHPKETFEAPEHRRMVYAFKVRMEQDGVFGAFDCPDGSLAVARRSLSTTPLQALNLFNSGFVLQQAGSFARRLQREAGGDTPRQVRLAWQLALGRDPGPRELEDAVALAGAHGVPSLTRALLNANEFLFIP